MPDFIPRRDLDLISWGDNFLVKLELYRDKIKANPEDVAAVASTYADFERAMANVSRNLRTVAHTIAKNEARDAFVGEVRAIVNRNIRHNPLLNDAEKVDLGLHALGKHRPTPSPAPLTMPEIEIISLPPRVIRIAWRDAGKNYTRKPKGVAALELVYLIQKAGAGEPQHESEFIRSKIATRPMIELSFDINCRGMEVWLMARWIGRTAEEGPMSQMRMAIVP